MVWMSRVTERPADSTADPCRRPARSQPGDQRRGQHGPRAPGPHGDCKQISGRAELGLPDRPADGPHPTAQLILLAQPFTQRREVLAVPALDPDTRVQPCLSPTRTHIERIGHITILRAARAARRATDRFRKGPSVKGAARGRDLGPRQTPPCAGPGTT